MEKFYDKLVRDNIPEIIRNNGGEPYFRILNDDEYWQYLLKKDNEEKEFCDCLIEFENIYICIQIKEKSEDSTSLPYKWYKNKILHIAKNPARANIF